jgi:predicted phosphodiesterase
MRALILSDIHANLEALTAVLDAAGAYDQLWNLGDLVGYGGSPNQVIERMQPLETLVVRGNHDRVCSGMASLTGFNPVARAAALWTREELSPANKEWLERLPRGPVFPTTSDDEKPVASCVHGSPLDEDQYILNMRDAWAPLQQMKTQITFFGHTHIQGGFAQREHEWRELRPRYPVTRSPEARQTETEVEATAAKRVLGRAGKSGRAARKAAKATVEQAAVSLRNQPQSWTLELEPGTRHLINPGSVGQPRDYDWRAAFALYDSEALTITFHRVPYDLIASQGRILMAGLPERLAGRLREGR